MNGTSLNAGVTFLHMDDNIIIETTSGRLSAPKHRPWQNKPLPVKLPFMEDAEIQ